MCGIFGSIGVRLSEETIDLCCDSLTHRGPDGRGVWKYRDINLAHRRLAILDTSEDGHQPMEYLNGRYCITFNGEIYNFIEIRHELEGMGYSFRSNSDTEVVLAAYNQWKDDCVLKFNGMWAFAIYDKEEDELFISRDRMGVKPLYYAYIDDGIVFASEMKAIIPCMKKVQANEKMINFFRYFHHYEFKEDCLIKGIKRFPPGCNAKVKGKRFKISRYWNTLDHLIEVPSSYSEQVEMFRELFLDACRIRMRSDVTIGTALSGGLDSSAVLCGMNKVASDRGNFKSEWQHAYIAGFPGSVLDESRYAKMVTDFLGIPYTHIEIDHHLDEKEIYRQTYIFEEMWMNSQIPQMSVYKNERMDGTVVSLDGHGADELFAGYTFDMKYALIDNISDEERLNIAQTIFLAEDVEKQEIDLISWEKVRRKDAYSRYFIESLYRAGIVKSKYMCDRRFSSMDSVNKMLFYESHEKTLPTMLRNYDRDSMASSIEVRMPFLDYRIVQFAFSIPVTSKLRNGYSKAIIRDALEDIMPTEIVRRKDKKGFNAPLNEWMRENKEVYSDIVDSIGFMNSSLVNNPRKVKENLFGFLNNPSSNYKQDLITAQKLWMEINMYIWESVMLSRKYVSE